MEASSNILTDIKMVYKQAEHCKLNTALFNVISKELKFIGERLDLTQIQSFFFSIIFCKCLGDTAISRDEITRYLSCEVVDIMLFEPDVFELFEKKLLRRERAKTRRQLGIMRSRFTLSKQATEAVLYDKDIKSVSEIKFENASECIDYVYEIMKEIDREGTDFSDINPEIDYNLNLNKELGFIVDLFNEKLDTEAICVLLFYIGSFRIGDKHKCIKELSVDLYGENTKAADLMQNMAAGDHPLLKADFLKACTMRHTDEFEFQISGKTKGLMRKYSIIPEFKTIMCKDTFDLLYTVETLFVKQDSDTISSNELLSQVEELLVNNEDLQIVKELNSLEIKRVCDVAIYLKALYDGAVGRDTSIEKIAESVYENKREAVLLQNEIVQESNPLIKKDLVEVKEASFFSQAQLCLTENSQQLLTDCGMKLPDKTNNNYSILPENIKSKPLFYNDEDASQMQMLKQILDEDNFLGIQKRMGEKALSIGVVALLYGYPGTGKTESVYQFAKSCGREVVQVDISQSKSMWFGESEKQIKKIFTRYEQYAKRCELKPILLFNEADAIISKRKDVSASNVAQTENAIQNILLEEFENFTGICIATTNLVDNLDPAFERRFLYKIELSKPNTSTLAKIWQSKVSETFCYDIFPLAEKYPFSGGQIDNIVKKIEMHEILHGAIPSYQEIETWCNAEGFKKQGRVRIGFAR